MKLLVKVVLIFLCYYVADTMAGFGKKVGGIGDDEKESGDDVKNMLTSLSSDIKTAALAAYAGTEGANKPMMEEHFKTAEITPLGHKTQIVAGTNYFVRTKIGDYIFHVRIYRDLKQNSSLSRVIGPKEESDPILYF